MLKCWKNSWAVGLVVVVMGYAATAFSQGVEVAAGASSLTGVNGVTLTRYAGDRVSVLSLGGNGSGFVVGGATELHREDGVTRYGDTVMGFTLPTDMDAAGRSVGARGVDWRQASGQGSVELFAGKTGEQMGMGYLQSVDPQRWGMSAVVKRQITERLGLQVLGAAGAAHAALVSAAWHKSDRVEVAATTGWNAGSGIFALSAKLRGDSWSVRMNETVGHIQLRPATNWLSEMHVPERAGFNVQVEKDFSPWLRGDVSRVAYGKDVDGGLPDGARLHEAGLTAHAGDVQVGGRVLESADGFSQTKGLAGLARWTHGVWSVESMVAESWREGSARQESWVVTGSRQFASRVKATAGLDVSNGAPSVVAGVDVLGRWGSVGVNERMVYVPFGPQTGFVKVTELRVRLHPKGVETSVSTLVGGGLPWTYSAVSDHFVETQAGGAGEAGVRVLNVDLAKYLVRGRVIDETGQPVMAAAVRVGEQTVWTGADGEWEVRERRAAEVRVKVVAEEFLTSRKYATSEADRLVTPAVESEVLPIVLRVKECRECSMQTEHGPSAAEPIQAPVVVRPEVVKKRSASLLSVLRDSWGPLRRVARVIWRGDLR